MTSVTYALQIAGPNALYMDITNGTGKMRSQVVNSNGYLGMMNAGDLAFNTSGIERVRITANGNVGISTTNPNAKLEVNGDISATNLRLSGNLYVSGSQTFDGVTFANGGVSATGIITATSFSGDGSQLTGLAAGDRIISGTSNVTVAQDGSVTITTAGGQRLVIGDAGVNRFDGRLDINNSTLGGNALNVYTAQAGRMVSFQSNGATNGVSLFGVSQGNALTGNATIEAVRAALNTDRRGDIAIYQSGVGTARFNALALSTGDAQSSYGVNGGQYWSVGLDQSAGSAFKISADDDLGTNDRLIVLPGGNVGIGMVTPTAALQVSGSFTVSTSAQTTTPSLYVGTNGNIGVGTSTPAVALDIQMRNASEGLRIRRHNSSGQYIDIHESNGIGHYFDAVGSGTKWVTFRNYDAHPGGGYAFYVSNATVLGLAVATTGNVGIGTTAPSATLHVSGTARITSWTAIAANITPTTELDVYGTISATNILVNGAPITATADRITSGTTQVTANLNGPISFTTAGTERMVINSSGNVGIGTTNPTAPLHVSGTSGFVSVKFKGQYNALGVLTGDTNTVGIGFDNGSDGYSNGFFAASGNLRLRSNSVERMRIDSAGNVGIGTTNPSSPLEISGTTAILTLEDGSGIYGGSIRFKNSGTTKWTLGGGMDGADIDSFGLSNSSGVEKLHLTQAGNVGIGTAAPSATLHVSGTAQIISRTLIGGSGTPSATLQVSGSLLLAGNDNIPCTDSVLGLVRRNPTTGRLQACR